MLKQDHTKHSLFASHSSYCFFLSTLLRSIPSSHVSSTSYLKPWLKNVSDHNTGWLPPDHVFKKKNPTGFEATVASPHPFWCCLTGKGEIFITATIEIFITATINIHATDFSTCCPCSQAKFSLLYPVQPLVKKQYTYKTVQIPYSGQLYWSRHLTR